jgi:polysaccharide export outer membrane protein
MTPRAGGVQFLVGAGRRAAAVLGLLFLAACAGGPSFPAAVAPMTVANPAEGYLLEPGNRVRVVVFGEANLSGDFVIDPSGSLAMPLIGSVPASGITGRALTERIETVLRRDGYLREPRVSVEVVTFRPIYVLGEVRAPGEFPYTTGMTVLSAIARAGGFDYRAYEQEVVLIRTEDGGQKDYRATERTPVLPGDIVRVYQRRF